VRRQIQAVSRPRTRTSDQSRALALESAIFPDIGRVQLGGPQKLKRYANASVEPLLLIGISGAFARARRLVGGRG
jgi:hypothetical protein